MTTTKPRRTIAMLAVVMVLAPLALASSPALAQGHGHHRRGPAAEGHTPGHGDPGHGGPGLHGAHEGAFGPGPGAHMMMLHRVLSRLDLSEGQREEIGSLVETGRESNEGLHTDLMARRESLHQAMRADDIDESAIRSAVLAAAELEAELAVRGAHLLAAVRETLTPEQRQRAAELLERGREWREGRREGGRGGRGPA